jgi:4-hydroxy-tetrahydrodipicolinate synthase
MIEAHLEGRTDVASGLHQRLLPLISTLMTAASNPIPVKTALNRLGFSAGPFRRPLTPMDEATTAKVMRAVEAAGDLVTFEPRVEVA